MEDVHVMKLVYFVARIPKHLDLHFYDFLRIYRHFQSLLFLKTKEKEKENLHLGPWTSFFFSPRVPGWFEKQRRGGRRDSGAWGQQRRGELGGGARGEREQPWGGLGGAWDGRWRRLRGTGAAASGSGSTSGA